MDSADPGIPEVPSRDLGRETLSGGSSGGEIEELQREDTCTAPGSFPWSWREVDNQHSLCWEFSVRAFLSRNVTGRKEKISAGVNLLQSHRKQSNIGLFFVQTLIPIYLLYTEKQLPLVIQEKGKHPQTPNLKLCIKDYQWVWSFSSFVPPESVPPNIPWNFPFLLLGPQLIKLKMPSLRDWQEEPRRCYQSRHEDSEALPEISFNEMRFLILKESSEDLSM